MTASVPQSGPPAVDVETLLDVVATDHMREWVELVQLRALVKQLTTRNAALEQAVRDAANPPAAPA